ncbi:hypothetical protein OAT84_01220 [Gammaproteobacteria bacterium]|nr:hypothetical protein [Gammaproteobacteria bacterium]
MTNRLFAGLLLCASTCMASTQPHLFLGGMVGSSITSILPENQTATPTTLASILGATKAEPDPVQLEKSLTTQQHFIFSPVVGMTFPIAGLLIIEGSVNLDLRKNEYTVSNKQRSNQVMASIDRQISIHGAAQMRISKQYAIGPMFGATIARNISEMYGAGAKENEHNIFSFGFQSTYEVNDSFSIGIHCSTTLDQQINLESPVDVTKNLDLDYKDAKLMISVRFMPL